MSPLPVLSDVEEQIVLLVARGTSHRAIADELGISVKAVDWHVARARRKLAQAAALHDHVQRRESAPERKEEVR